MKHAYDAFASLDPLSVRIVRKNEARGADALVPALRLPLWLVRAIAGIAAPEAYRHIEEYAAWMKRKNPYGQKFADKLLATIKPLAALNEDVVVMAQPV